ncbi:hypothetical protein YC2023_072237 [Brassica napus]
MALMRELRKGIRLKFRNRDMAVDGNVRNLPTQETAQPEVGSSGWKGTALRVVSGASPVALENPEDRVLLTPCRTHTRIRSCNTLIQPTRPWSKSYVARSTSWPNLLIFALYL